MPALPPQLSWLASLRSQGVVVTDPLGRTLWVNAEFERRTGYALADLRGRTPGSVLQGPDTDPEARRVLRQAIEEGVSCQAVRILNHHKDGSVLWQSIDIVPVPGPDGRISHFVSLQSAMPDREHVAAWHHSQVALLRDLRLVGFWERDLATGRARWDSVCRAIWALPDGDDVPTLAALRSRLTGTQRDALRRYEQDLAAGVLRGETAYPIPVGNEERHVRSVWQREGDLVHGVLVDVTSEHVLGTERTRLLQSLALAAPAARFALWRHDLRTDLIHWLPQAMPPFAEEGALASSGEALLSAVFPEDLPGLLAGRRRALEQPEVVETEYRVLDAQGRMRHLLCRQLGALDPDTGERELVGVTLDVTAQREREIALRRRATVQRLALQALRAGCFHFDLPTRRFFLDASIQALYGLPRTCAVLAFDEWLGMVVPEDRETVRAAAQAVFAAPDRPSPVRFRIRTADGRLLWIESDRVPEHGADGRVIALIGTHRDITEEVRRSREIAAQAEAAVIGRTRSELLATLAHELRTPLNAVSGFAQLLQLDQQGAGHDPFVTGTARHIQSAARMLSTLLDDLGDFAAAEAGTLRWQADEVPLRGLVEECRRWLQQSDPTAGPRLRLGDTDPALRVRADPTRTRQIVINLLGNALKYSAGEVSVRAWAAGPQVRLEVEDRGAGMSAAQIVRAFEPFERLGQEKGQVKGSGLGLAVCRRLARLMGGDVTVHSEVGLGSVFVLSLPAHSPENV